jgi:carboxypeptidase Taq
VAGDPFVQLKALLAEVGDLGRARALLAWDEQTMMPPAGAAARAGQLATLTRIRHTRLASDELGHLLDEAAETVGDGPYESDGASLIRVARRDWERARRVPAELRGEMARSSSEAQHAWIEARARSDFPAFLPHLQRNLDLTRRYVECLTGFEGCERAYDVLLDGYEPGMRTAQLEPVMAQLRDELAPLVAGLTEGDPARGETCLHGEFPIEHQRRLALALLGELPLPAGGWRLDDTVHPFASSMGPGDVRVTTRFDERYLGTAVWSVMHEAGHALYGAGLPRELYGTPLYRSVSLGFDESQSRLWENWVGRGYAYSQRLHGHLLAAFPERFDGSGPDDVYAAANRFRRSAIRIEADELTYNLHIVIRFELELELVEGELDLAELPEAWNSRVAKYLGIDVPDDAAGVLQDIHWATGSFGYFPTYTLGNLLAAQLYEQARGELGDLDELIRSGDLAVLDGWLRERLYRHGGRFKSPEMVERLVGSLDVQPLMGYLRAKLEGPTD